MTWREWLHICQLVSGSEVAFTWVDDMDFIQNHVFLYKTNSTSVNVYNVKAAVSDSCGNNSVKKYTEMTAEEYGTLDVWQHNEASVFSEILRYGNNVPIWQKSMQTRHYDVNNEGFATGDDSDRSSLENQIHGYDLSSIIKGSVQNPTMYS